MINIKGLRAIRKKRGLTLQQLGDLTGIDFNSISRYERGVLVPNVRTIEKIASALNVTTDELLNGPKNESWTLEIKFDNSQKELVNMTADFPCISSVTGSKFGAVL
ncbi:MAG: helix-turn-helix transcriptional regulator, partial [Synergistaceae bacterium]|nr:helix-turn-helix transcriptional regulator [Synergistaceae bacterium]